MMMYLILNDIYHLYYFWIQYLLSFIFYLGMVTDILDVVLDILIFLLEFVELSEDVTYDLYICFCISN